MIMWLGLGTATILALTFLFSVFPVVANTVTGVQQVEPVLVRAARAFGGSGVQSPASGWASGAPSSARRTRLAAHGPLAGEGGRPRRAPLAVPASPTAPPAGNPRTTLRRASRASASSRAKLPPMSTLGLWRDRPGSCVVRP
jgi:hypothetical protein